MRSARTLVIVAASAATLMLAPGAAADEKQAAREMFRAAESAFDRGDYRNAALGFEAANRKSANGGALFNAAVAWSRSSEPARAAEDFEKAIASGDLDEKSLNQATTRKAALEAKLAHASIQAPSGVLISIAHVARAPAPLRIYLEPGSHVVRANFPDGEEREKTIEAIAGTNLQIDFNETEPSSPPSSSAIRTPPPTEQRRQPPPSIWPWVTIGSGAAIVLAGGYLRYRGYRANQEFEEGGRRDSDAHDRATALSTWSGVALIGGAVIAAGGVVWLIIDTNERHRASSARLEAAISNGVSIRLRHF